MISSPSNTLSQPTAEALLRWVLRILALLTASILVLVLAFLILESLPIIQRIGPSRLLTDPGWFPTEGSYGLLPMVVGSLAVALGATLLAGPLGLASAIFCYFYAPPLLGKAYRHVLELLAGIPSVVFGFWGLVVLIPIIAAWHPPGPSLLAGILILTLMILPTIMLLTHAQLTQVPSLYIQNATALGFRQWTLIVKIVLPAIRSGIFTGILLGFARALGETMALLMVCGNVVQLPSHIFDPVRTLTANIALEMAYAVDMHRSALFASGLFLLALVIILVALAERVRPQDRYVLTS